MKIIKLNENLNEYYTIGYFNNEHKPMFLGNFSIAVKNENDAKYNTYDSEIYLPNDDQFTATNKLIDYITKPEYRNTPSILLCGSTNCFINSILQFSTFKCAKDFKDIICRIKNGKIKNMLMGRFIGEPDHTLYIFKIHYSPYRSSISAYECIENDIENIERAHSKFDISKFRKK